MEQYNQYNTNYRGIICYKNNTQLKRITIILIIIFGLILICHFLLTPKIFVNDLNNQFGLLTQEQKDIVFNQIIQFPNKTQMAISLIKDDSCIFYGAIKNNDTVSEIDNRFSIFEIGSITKVFTATLLANFILDRTIPLDRAINGDLDFELNNNIQIRYKDLANHTSGLPKRPSDIFYSAIKSPLNPYSLYNYHKLEKYLKMKISLKREGGIEYEYSNLGMGILGYVLCQNTQTDYETLLQEKILEKYGLTCTTSDNEKILDNLVEGLGPLGNKTPNWDFASLEGCGNIVSSTYDITKFIQAQFDTCNIELSLTRETSFIVNSALEIGLAWHILKDKADNVWYWHNGGTGGYRSSVVFDTENRTGILVLTNISVGHRKNSLVDNLCFELMETITPN